MSLLLVHAAIRACVRIYQCLDWMTDCEADDHDFMHNEIGYELSDVFESLTKQLSVELQTDAVKLVHDIIEAELKMARAAIKAAGLPDYE